MNAAFTQKSVAHSAIHLSNIKFSALAIPILFNVKQQPNFFVSSSTA